jgi:hypothetical protein
MRSASGSCCRLPPQSVWLAALRPALGALREVRGQGQGTYFALCPGTFWRLAELAKSVSDRFGKGHWGLRSQVVLELHASLEG